MRERRKRRPSLGDQRERASGLLRAATNPMFAVHARRGKALSVPHELVRRSSDDQLLLRRARSRVGRHCRQPLSERPRLRPDQGIGLRPVVHDGNGLRARLRGRSLHDGLRLLQRNREHERRRAIPSGFRSKVRVRFRLPVPIGADPEVRRGQVHRSVTSEAARVADVVRGARADALDLFVGERADRARG